MLLAATDNRAKHSAWPERDADVLAEVCARYQATNPKTLAQWRSAHDVKPGGNTRTVLHYEPFPLTVIKGEGSCLYDLDGHRYVDFLGEYSAGLYGHSNAIIQDALKKAIDGGTVLGSPNRWEAQLARILCQRFPSIDLVRFTNSGTEANLMALGAARVFTGRDKVMVMDEAYHGGVLSYLHGGSPINVPFDLVQTQFNDLEGTLKLIDREKQQLAAIIVEPMMGGGGCIPAERAYLEMLRSAASENGIVLIFDEVMTSRSSAGGLQERWGIVPDMTTLGKYIGGGCSFGAFGGRREIMAQFDPTHPESIGHAGTFNNNVMSMAAGFAGLSEVFTRQVADELFDKGESFKNRLNRIATDRKVKVQATGCGSIIALHTSAGDIRSPRDIDDRFPQRKTVLHLEMLMRGFVYAQRGYLTLNLAMDDHQREAFASAFDEVIQHHKKFLNGDP